MPKRLEELFTKTASLTTRQQIMDEYLTLGRELGFDMACFLELQSDFKRFKLSSIPMVASFPEDFVEAYFSGNFLAIDPVVERAYHRAMPYRWRQVGDLKPLTESEQFYMQQLDDAGISDGIAVPLFGPHGKVGFAGFGMKHGKGDLSPHEMQELQLLAYHLYTHYLDKGEETAVPMLSPREREVLQWIAVGKSNSVIADILGISEHTVDSLLRRAYRKLNVTTRAAAVVKAVQWGIITLG